MTPEQFNALLRMVESISESKTSPRSIRLSSVAQSIDRARALLVEQPAKEISGTGCAECGGAFGDQIKIVVTTNVDKKAEYKSYHTNCGPVNLTNKTRREDRHKANCNSLKGHLTLGTYPCDCGAA